MFCAALHLCAGCSEYGAMEVEYVSPVISSLGKDNVVIPEEWDSDTHVFRMFWSRARCIRGGVYEAGTGFMYSVEASRAEDMFSPAVTVSETGDSSYIDIYTSTLAALYDSLHREEDGPSVVMALRIKSVYGDAVLHSDPVMVTVSVSEGQLPSDTPVLPDEPLVPDEPEIPGDPVEPDGPAVPEDPGDIPFVFDALQDVFIVGDFNGWNVGNPDLMLPMFKDSNSATDYRFVFTGHISEGHIAFCTADGTSISLDGIGEDGYECLNPGFKSIVIDVEKHLFEISDYDASDAAVWNQMGFIGTFTGWASEHFMTRFSDENSHIWYLNVDVGRSSETYHCGKFRANGSFENLWNNYLGKEWETPFGSMTRAVNPDVNIYFDMNAASYRVVFNDLTGHYILRRIQTT